MTFATDAENPQWMTDHPDYPRRQLQRRTWQPLNGAWQFSLDAAGVAEPAQLATLEHTITVPFAPESALSGINDRGYHPSVWYRREVRVERTPGTRVLLHFGAVDHRATVWANGALVGTHEGGHTSFSFDITEQLGAGSTHTIDVRADDDPHDLAKPRGKQDWLPEPHSIWYPRTTGIWQTVWLEEVPEVRIERLRWQADIERWQIGLGIEFTGDVTTGDAVRVRLRHGNTVLADDRYAVTGRELHRSIALADPGIDDARNQLLWSPESPTLIEAEIELMRGDDVVDSIRSYTAMRTIESSRGRILLNKRPYYLRMVLDQGYWADSLMTPPSADAIVRDITLAKEAGFNGVRKHQKIEDPRYLYWADRLGLLVWEEMPSAYRFSERGLRQLTAEWSEAIDRDINHPCIIAWVPYNESWGVPDLPSSAAQRSAVQALYYLTRALDPSRLVIGNDGWELAATDIIAIHDYSADPVGIRVRYSDPAGIPLGHGPSGRVTTLEGHNPEGQPVMLTEFGGIAAGGTTEHGTETWGYSVTGNADELRDAFVTLLGEVRAVPMFSGYCYTQFADTFQEANGLFTEDRTPKFALEAMRAAVRGETS